jgi:RNA polymerase sigma-70 factor, ECF subfamily
MKDAETLETEVSAVSGAFTFDEVPRLTAALKRGDEAAFEWLHHAWSGRINRYCFALAAGDEGFAGEIAQAMWWRLVKHIHMMNDEEALWSWIACAARHAATDIRRTGNRYLLALGRFFEWRTQLLVPVRDEANDSLLAALEAALHKLDPEDRILIESRYFARDPLETIGARLALSARAVEGRLARLRHRLRGMIAEELAITIR